MSATAAPRTTTRAPHRRSTAAWTLGAPALVVAVALALALAWRPDLPDPVAIHWGPDGTDGYSPVLPFVLAMLALIAAGAVAFWALGTFLGRAAMTRRLANGTAVGYSVFLASVLLTTLEAQRGLIDASAAAVGDAALTLSLVAACVTGAIAAALTPPDPARPTSAAVPADARTLPLGEQEQAVWVRDVGRRSSVPLVAGAVVFGCFIGAATGLWLFAAVLALAISLLLVTMLLWDVTVSSTGMTARSLLGRPRVHVPLDEVERAEVIEIDPLREFGGWGLRTGVDGRTGIVLRKGPAIEVHRTGGRVVVVTVEDAATGVALLNTLAARARVVR